MLTGSERAQLGPPLARSETAPVLKSCRIGRRPIFFVGTIDSGITVLSQQVRALTLAWALVEAGVIECHPWAGKQAARIAVIGAGFAGLTFVAGLLAKD